MSISQRSRTLASGCSLLICLLVSGETYAQPTVVSTVPTRNVSNHLVGTNISATFSAAMSVATNSSYVVHGSMTGKVAGAYTGGATTVPVFNPTANFRSGEQIEVIFTGGTTSGFTNTANTPIASGGYVYRFRTASGVGPVNFTAFRIIGTGTSKPTEGIAIADIDGDGDLDLVIANDGQQNVAYKQHNGTFTAAANFGTGSDASKNLALGDLNGDGNVDVALADAGSFSTSYLNDGAGNLNTGANNMDSGDARIVDIGDVNGDGHLDVVLGYYSVVNRVIINNGSGGTSKITFNGAAATNTRGIALGDTDNDGDLDVAIGNFANQNDVYVNDGVGNFTAGNNYGTGSDNTTSTALVDIDGDGDLDAASANFGGQNTVYQNNGAGSFVAGVVNFGPASDLTESFAFGDFDGDADLDVAVGNSAAQNVIYLSTGAGAFTAGSANFGTGSDVTSAIGVADLNGDGFLDLAVGNINHPNWVYYNATQPTVSVTTPTANAGNAAVNANVTATFSVAMTGGTQSTFQVMGSMTGKRAGVYSGGATTTLTFDPTIDFKKGEQVQVVFTTGASINSTGLLSTQDLTLAKPYVLQFRAATVVGPGNWSAVFSNFYSSATNGLETGDVDGDGDIDVVIGNNGAANFAFLNDGSGALTGSTTFDAGGDPTVTLDLGDVDGDGDLDVATGTFAGQSVVRLNDGSGNFGAPINFGGASDNTRPVVFGDADGDGGLDIAVGIDGGQNLVHFNSGSATFTSSKTFGTGSDQTKHLDWGDVDNDGDLDLYVGNFSEANAIYLNDGFASFTAGNTFGTGSDQTHWLDVGDIDADGDVDVVMANMSGAQNFPATNNGSGVFTAGTAFGLTTIARSVVLGDADGDGDLDAAVTYDAASQNAIYLNAGAGVFSGGPQDFGDAAAQTMIAAWADMDGDGDLDIVTGNNGAVSAVHFNVTPPTLSALTPVENETRAPQTVNLSATFSAAMSTATSDNFSVYSSMTGKRSGVYSGSGTTVIGFDPSTNLLPNEIIQATFTGGFSNGLRTLTNIPLAKPFVWTFRGQAAAGPANFSDLVNGYGSGTDNSNALAAADVDADGDIDLAVGNGGAQNLVYKNVTGGLASTVNFGSGADNTFALAFADVDADGDVDLAVGNDGGAQDAFYLNDGAGNFTAGTNNFGLASTNTEGLDVGDIDGDGHPDIVAGHDNSEQNVAYLNNGAGVFTATTNFGTGSDQSKDVALGDINNDGALDVAVSNDAQQDVVYLNDGSGKFTAGTKNYGSAADAGRNVAIGDINNDGKLDIAVGNNAGQNAAYLNDGAGNLTAGTKNFGSGTDNTFSIALGDINGDGYLDVAAGNNAAQNAVYQNDGAGNFSAGTHNFGNGSDNTEEVVFVDLINDGDLDVAAVNAGQQNEVYLNETAATLSSTTPLGGAVNIAVGSNLSAVFSTAMTGWNATTFKVFGAQTGNKAGAYSGSATTTLTFNPSSDFRSGEQVEAVFTDGFTGGVVSVSKSLPLAKPYVWRFTAAAGTGPAVFSGISQPFGSGTDASVAVALADIDNDGDLDVGVGNNAASQNAAYLNDGSGNFTAGSKNFGTGADNTEGVLFADIDNDGDLDVAVGNNATGQNVAYLNDGVGNLTAGTRNFGSGADDSRALELGDIDGDGDLDIAVGNGSSQQNAAYLNDGAGNFTAGTQNFGAGSDETRALVFGDPDKDGDLDIAVGNAFQQSAVYLNDGAGKFSGGTRNFGTAGDETKEVFFVDVDADGDLDMAAAKGSSQQNVIYLNDGAGNFTAGTRNFGSGADTTPGAVFADLDGDGDLDAALGNAGGQDAAYLNDGAGNFTAGTRNYSTGSADTRAIAAGDVDGDGDLDIAAATANAQNQVHLNVATPTLTTPSPTAHFSGAATSTNISAVFSEAMTAATATNFTVYGGYGGKKTGSYSGAATTTLTFNPSTGFKPGEEVQVVFSNGGTNGIRNVAGIPLSDGYVLQFRAGTGTGPGNFPTTGIAFGTGADNTFAVGFGDFNADGQLDAIAGNNAGQDAVYLNTGFGAAPTLMNFGSGADLTAALALGDLDGDGDLDAATGRSSGQNAAYLNNASGSLVTAKNFGTGTDQTLAVDIGDADGDGDLDVAAGNGSAQQNVVYLNDGSGNFSTGGNFGATDNTSSLVFVDVDNDGDLDLAVGNDAAQNVVYLNDGAGGFVTAGSKNFATGSSATKALAFADVDADGDADAGVGNDAAQNAVYLNDASGNFTAGTRNFGTGTDATRALVFGDAEGDGDLDLAVGNNAAQNVVYLNDGAGNFTAGTRNFGTATDATLALAFGDVEGDGDLDLAVANNAAPNGLVANSAFAETVAARGLLGVTPAELGENRVVFRVGVTGDGVVGVQNLALTLEDLSSATGLVATDFDSLTAYVSRDTLLDGADSLLVTVNTVNVGSTTTLNFTTTQTIAKDTLRYFLATVGVDTAAVIGHTFKLGVAVGGLGTTIGGLGTAVTAQDANQAIMTPFMQETTVATGLAGITKALPGTEVKLLGIGMTGNGSETVNGIALTLSDLSTATGIDTSNIDSLNFYVSVDSVFSAGSDSLLGIAPRDSLVFGAAINIAPATPHVPPIAQERFYLVTAVVDSTVVDNRAFRAGFASGGLVTSKGALGTAVVASDSGQVAIQVKAVKLALLQAPADTGRVDTTDAVISGRAFSTQPIIEAQDAKGNIDEDFAENIVASVSSGTGSLGGFATRIVVKGRADFSGLSYAAGADGEAFTLTFDDESGGEDLVAVATTGLSADVVATRLIFTRQPAPLLDPGLNFAPDSVVVAAQDSQGLIDTDFTGKIRIQAVAAQDTSAVVDSLAAVPADSVTASAGVATWTELKLPTADLIKLKASNDTLHLQPGLSNIVAIPGGLVVGGADSLVAATPLAGLAGRGGQRLVVNALGLRAGGERMVLTTVNIKPIFQGLTSSELRHLDLILDLDADGQIDSTDHSVLAAAVDDAGSGVELSLSVLDTLPADTLRHYLLVADLDSTVRATDVLRIDVSNIAVGNGLATGVVPAVPVRSVPGRNHVVTGQVDIASVDLVDPRIGQAGQLIVVFTTVSDLAAGDELVFDFPPGFNVADVAIDSSSITPSGVLPGMGAESAGRSVVLELGAVEPPGRYRIVLTGVKNPAVNQGAVVLRVRTRLDDNTAVDGEDPTPPGLNLTGSGRLDLSAVELRNGHAGGRGGVGLALQTASALAAGDEITLVFPPGFDLSQAKVSDSTRTPAGSRLVVAAVDSSAGVLVLNVQANEGAGDYNIVVDGIGFPAVAAKDLAVVVQTRRKDDAVVDLSDAEPPLFALPGHLQMSAGAHVDNGLAGAAGTGVEQLVLTSFALRARGEDLAVSNVELLARLSGVGSGELTDIAVIFDRDGDGVVDQGDTSIALQPLAVIAHGVPVRVGLIVQGLARDSTLSYLIVGDVGSNIGSTDRIQIDINAVGSAVGPLSGVKAFVTGGPLAGPVHFTSGSVDLASVELANRQTGQSERVGLEFSTASALAAGDRITLVFPDGFDLGSVRMDTSSRGPSGTALLRDSAASTRSTVVLKLAAAEPAGTYRVGLDQVVNPGIAAQGLTIEIRSEQADGTVVDGTDPDPFLFAIITASAPTACGADFDGDGRVYFADLFLFGDAFGRGGSSIYDLDGDRQVGFSDFFVFTEVFGVRCDTTGVDPVDDTVLALKTRVDLLDGIQMDFVIVRPGSFTMGSPAVEVGRAADEGPERTVELTETLYLGQFEVTQAQWHGVMGTAPWLGLPAVVDSADHPAVYISWNDALAFVQTLNAAAGDSLYRLPTEAEWEYAARAGTQTRWSFGDDEAVLSDFAWTRRVPPVVSELVTHPVGTKKPNSWELYDMHGSAAEWTLDYYEAYGIAAEVDPRGPTSGTVRVLRGGGITLGAAETRSAARSSFGSSTRLSTFGFRIVRRIEGQ